MHLSKSAVSRDDIGPAASPFTRTQGRIRFGGGRRSHLLWQFLAMFSKAGTYIPLSLHTVKAISHSSTEYSNKVTTSSQH